MENDQKNSYLDHAYNFFFGTEKKDENKPQIMNSSLMTDSQYAFQKASFMKGFGDKFKKPNPGLCVHFYVLAARIILEDRDKKSPEEKRMRESIASGIIKEAKAVKSVIAEEIQRV